MVPARFTVGGLGSYPCCSGAMRHQEEALSRPGPASNLTGRRGLRATESEGITTPNPHYGWGWYGGATLLKLGGGFTGVCCLNSKSYPYFVDVILNLFDSIFFFLIKVDL